MANREWLQRFGIAIRGVRELTGMTQCQLAALAHVSQPSISRLEREPGAWTPLATVTRVRAALRAALGAVDASALSPEIRHLLDERVGPMDASLQDVEPTLVADTLFDALAAIAVRVDRARRGEFLQIVEAAATIMARRPDPALVPHPVCI